MSAGHVDIALVRAVVVDGSLQSAVIDDEGRLAAVPSAHHTLHPRPDIRYIPIVDAPTVPLVLLWPKRGSHPRTNSFVAIARRATRHLRA